MKLGLTIFASLLLLGGSAACIFGQFNVGVPLLFLSIVNYISGIQLELHELLAHLKGGRR